MTSVDHYPMSRLGRLALPIVAILLFVVVVGATLAVAGPTLGYDFLAYRAAAVRLLDGHALYDLGFQEAGGFGLFYYPPLFAPIILPFGLLPETIAIWAWIVILLASFLSGVVLLPVSRTIRWWILLLAGATWLFAYSVKLGQVGPILFLLFAIGWRWLDDPTRLGASAAIGAAIKLQPGFILVWAALTRRAAAVVAGVAVLAVLAVVATLLAGVDAWLDFVRLIGQVADPITTVHNATPGSVAYQLGASQELASVIQWVAMAAVLVAVIVAARVSTGEGSYLVTVVASQLLSPVLWDHYAILLLLPVAYLCSRGWWVALVIPVMTAPLGLGSLILYPIAFFITVIATLVVGVQAKRPTAN